MTFTAIISGIFAAIKAFPVAVEYVEKAIDLWYANQERMDKNELEEIQKERKQIIKVIEQAKQSDLSNEDKNLVYTSQLRELYKLRRL